MQSFRLTRGMRGLAIPILLLALLLQAASAGAQTDAEQQVFVPVGGGYSDATLQGYAAVVVKHADQSVDETVDILVNPATYGDDPAIRQENIDLALQRTQQVEDACNAVVDTAVFEDGCVATLVPVFDANDTHQQANADPFEAPGLDGMFMLGGDQTIAMRILADSPVEAAMSDAFARGVVFGGTSAGAAVQSHTMLAGYTSSGWPYNALEKDQIIIWWADTQGAEPAYERGLSFGLDEVVTDQHFYQRGRITRSLNAVAQSDERFQGHSRLGLGVDYGTGFEVSDGMTISGVFGDSSAMVIDGETFNVDFSWKTERQTLSADNILTDILGQQDGISYDIASRTPAIDGNAVTPVQPGPWPENVLNKQGEGTLILGGDTTFDFSGQALQTFVDRAAATGSGRIAIVSAGYKNSGQAQKAGNEYAKALKDLGWAGSERTVDVLDYDPGLNASAVLAAQKKYNGTAGVLLVGGDQAQLAGLVPSSNFANLVAGIVNDAPVVMTDQAMTAIMGEYYVADPNPTDDNYQDVGIAAFQTGYNNIQPGLGIVSGAAFEPRLTYDQRWGRLYSLAQADEQQDMFVFGISEKTALVLDADGATVAGERSVVALDARDATFVAGDAGDPYTALNVALDLFAPGDSVPHE